jgi:CheY-like chemotaxis protein
MVELKQQVDRKLAGKVPPRALIADDQPEVLEALRLLLKSEGIQTFSVTSPAGVIDDCRATSCGIPGCRAGRVLHADVLVPSLPSLAKLVDSVKRGRNEI